MRTERPLSSLFMVALSSLIVSCGLLTEAGTNPERIVYVSLQNSFELRVMNVDGTQQRDFATLSDSPSCPSFSPNGQHLLFAGGNTHHIMIYELATRTEKTLTAGAAWDSCPAWSPDGTTIAFSSGPSTAPNGLGLYLLGPDGNNRRELRSSGFFGGLAWSPDGRWLAATSFPDSRIVLVDTNTGVEVRALTSGGSDFFPAWAPDGQRLAFSREMPGGAAIFSIKADGTDLRRLTAPHFGPAAIANYAPTWSPSGDRIVFYRIDASLQSHTGSSLGLMRNDGSAIPWHDAETILGQVPIWFPHR